MCDPFNDTLDDFTFTLGENVVLNDTMSDVNKPNNSNEPDNASNNDVPNRAAGNNSSFADDTFSISQVNRITEMIDNYVPPSPVTAPRPSISPSTGAIRRTTRDSQQRSSLKNLEDSPRRGMHQCTRKSPTKGQNSKIPSPISPKSSTSTRKSPANSPTNKQIKSPTGHSPIYQPLHPPKFYTFRSPTNPRRSQPLPILPSPPLLSFRMRTPTYFPVVGRYNPAVRGPCIFPPPHELPVMVNHPIYPFNSALMDESTRRSFDLVIPPPPKPPSSPPPMYSPPNRPLRSPPVFYKVRSQIEPPPNYELATLGLPEEILQKYHYRNVTHMFEWQYECLSSYGVLEHGKNLVYSAPTSSGKTLVAEILAIKAVLERKLKVIYILPFVAIAREKMFYFQDIFGSSGIRVEGFMGNYNPPGGFRAVNFAVCTIEKANGIINKLIEEGKLSDIGCVVVDELHLLSDPHRGYILEVMLTKLLFMIARNESISMQIVGMSATLPNLHLLGKWLNAAVYITTFRPVPLEETYVVGNVMFSSEFEKIREVSDFIGWDTTNDPVLQLCLETIMENCSILIFCPTKAWVESLAVALAKSFQKILNSGCEFAKRLREQFKSDLIVETLEHLKRCPSGMDSVLKKAIIFGIAFHHAGLTVDERDIIETSFRIGATRILVATSTLSSGVNLPARRVIIRSPMVYANKVIDILSYKQMAGRAGRTGKDTKGESIIMCRDEAADRRAVRQLLGSRLDPVSSCLGVSEKMKRAIMEIVATGVAPKLHDIEIFIACTLFKEEGQRAGNPVIDCINYLERKQFIRVQRLADGAECYIPTPLAKASLATSLPPDEGIKLFEELDKARQALVLDSELHLIYLVTPFNSTIENIDWARYLDLYEKLAPCMRRVGELVGISYGVLTNPHHVSREDPRYAIYARFYTALILQDIINEMTIQRLCIKYDCNRGVIQRLQLSASSFAGLVTTFCRELGWHKMETLFCEFQDRLEFGVSRELLDLMRLPIINRLRARALFKAGIENLVELANSDTYELENILYSLKPFENTERKGESKEASLERNQLRTVYVTGKKGLTEVEAAQQMIDDARLYLQNEIGVPHAKWEHTQVNYNYLNITLKKLEAPHEQLPSDNNDVPAENVILPHNNENDDPANNDIPIEEAQGAVAPIEVEKDGDTGEPIIHEVSATIHNNEQDADEKKSKDHTQDEVHMSEAARVDIDVEENKSKDYTQDEINMAEAPRVDIDVEGKLKDHAQLEFDTAEAPNIVIETAEDKEVDNLMHDIIIEKPVNIKDLHDSLKELKIQCDSPIEEGACAMAALIDYKDTDDPDCTVLQINLEQMLLDVIDENFKEPNNDNFDTADDDILNKHFDSILAENNDLDKSDSTSHENVMLTDSITKVFDDNLNPPSNLGHPKSDENVIGTPPLGDENIIVDTPPTAPQGCISKVLANTPGNKLRSKECNRSIADIMWDTLLEEAFADEVPSQQDKPEEIFEIEIPTKPESDLQQFGPESLEENNTVTEILDKTYIKCDKKMFDIIRVCDNAMLFNEFISKLKKQKTVSIALGCEKYNIIKDPIGLKKTVTVVEKFTHHNIKLIGFSVYWRQRDEMLAYYVDLAKVKDRFNQLRDQLINKTLRIFAAKAQLKLMHYCMNWPINNIVCQDPKVGYWMLNPDGAEKTLWQMVAAYDPDNSYIIPDAAKDLPIFEGFGMFTETDISAITRASFDAYFTWWLTDEVSASLQATDDYFTDCFTFEMKIIVILAKIEIAGMPVDNKRLNYDRDALKLLLNSLEKQAFHIYGKRFNLSSPLDVAKILHARFKDENVTKRYKKKLLQHTSHPLAEIITAWRKVNFTLNRVVHPILRALQNGRIHGVYKTNTATGRINMREPNLQSIPRNFVQIDPATHQAHKISIRTSIKALNENLAPEYHSIIIAADYSQLEMRILAHLSEDVALCAIMQSEGDLFEILASSWLQVARTSVDEDIRQKTKSICYGIIYGMSHATLAEKLNTVEEDAKKFSDSFADAYPGINVYTNKVIEDCRRYGYVETYCGRRRFLPHIYSANEGDRGKAERQAVNSTIQGSAADIVKKAMIRIDRKIEEEFNHGELRPKLIMHLHDELIFEVPRIYEAIFIACLKTCMEQAVPLRVPLPVKIQRGASWGTLQPHYYA